MKQVEPKNNLRYSSVVVDLGYTAVCPNCGLAYDLKQALIGKPRELRLTRCERCPSFSDRSDTSIWKRGKVEMMALRRSR